MLGERSLYKGYITPTSGQFKALCQVYTASVKAPNSNSPLGMVLDGGRDALHPQHRNLEATTSIRSCPPKLIEHDTPRHGL